MPKIDKNEFAHRLELIQHNTWPSLDLNAEIKALGIINNKSFCYKRQAAEPQMPIGKMYECYEKCYDKHGYNPITGNEIKDILKGYNAYYSFWMSAMEEIRVATIDRTVRPNTITLT